MFTNTYVVENNSRMKYKVMLSRHLPYLHHWRWK